MSTLHANILIIAIALVTVAGDFFLKRASEHNPLFTNRWFLAGVAIYALTAFGWVVAMKSIKLATIGALYSISTVILLALLGVVIFGEQLSSKELLGLVFAVLALLLINH
ncbi:MAG: transporter [Gammaproteobacteria bacterium]